MAIKKKKEKILVDANPPEVPKIATMEYSMEQIMDTILRIHDMDPTASLHIGSMLYSIAKSIQKIETDLKDIV